MVSKATVFIIQVVVLLVVSVIFFFWKGIGLVLLFFPIWFDKSILVHLRIHGYFGIELITIPVIISGIIYGPLFGFLFGFLVLPFTAGLFEMISWTVAQPMEIGWLPVIPSLNTFSAGIAGLIGGVLVGNPFMLIVAVGAAVKNVLDYVALKASSKAPVNLAIPLNFVFNVMLAYLLSPYFQIR